MIHIEKGQKIIENDGLLVFTDTGDYGDFDTIEYCTEADPSMALGAFQAQCVKYGNLVYRFADHKELGTEILRIDPTSTHTAASFVRMMNELSAQMDAGSLESDSLDQAISGEQASTQVQMNSTADDTNATTTPLVTTTPIVTSTNPVTNTPVSPLSADTSTTTPSGVDISTATSSPNIIDVASTTPSIISTSTPTDTSTTTPSTATSTTSSFIDNTASVFDAISTTTNNVSTTTEAISNVVDAVIDTVTGSSTTP